MPKITKLENVGAMIQKQACLIPEPELLNNEKRVYNINLYNEKVKFRGKLLIKTGSIL